MMMIDYVVTTDETILTNYITVECGELKVLNEKEIKEVLEQNNIGYVYDDLKDFKGNIEIMIGCRGEIDDILETDTINDGVFKYEINSDWFDDFETNNGELLEYGYCEKYENYTMIGFFEESCSIFINKGV